MIKRTMMGSEGKITSYSFWFLRRKWIISLSETKWHKGDKYKKAPIWFSVVGKDIRSVFIWKLAIGYQRKSNIKP